MRMKKCPVCGKRTYRCWSGTWEGYKKLSPDYCRCSYCGFEYTEHISFSEEELAKKYEKKWRKVNEISSNI